jgi:NitT/TauT family transport system permease protein
VSDKSQTGTTSTAAPGSGARRQRFAGIRQMLISFVILFLIWELAVYVFEVKSYLLPAPSLIWTEFVSRWAYVLDNTWITTSEIIVGYLIAIAVSVPLAVFVAYFPTMERTIYPIIVFLQIVPKIAIAPLFIIWFGFGFTPKILLVFLLSFFPIVVASISGFKSIDDETMELAQSTGASPWMIFRKIRLPHAMPAIFTGLKVAAALSSTAAVVAEFVASDSGLGYLLLRYNGDIETPMVFAIIIVLSIVGLIVYYAVEYIEKLAIPWHVSQRGEHAGIRITN